MEVETWWWFGTWIIVDGIFHVVHLTNSITGQTHTLGPQSNYIWIWLPCVHTEMWMQYVFPSMEKKSVCEPMCCLSWSIPFPLNHRPVCGTDYHMTIKVQGCRLYPEFQRKCILYILHRIIFISHTKLQLIIHFPCSNFKKKDQQKKGIQFTSFQGHFCRYDLVPGTSSTSHGSENRHSHWENGGTVGMVPLRINPIYTLYTGYLLDISLLKGSLGS